MITQEELLRQYRSDLIPHAMDDPIEEVTGLGDPESGNTLLKRNEKAIGEQAHKSFYGEDHPTMNSSENRVKSFKPPTPEEAKEKGMIGSLIDGTSDAVLGLYAGVGYGIDEMAVSASKVLNMISFGSTPEYEARAISNYMKGIEQKGVAGETTRAIGQFLMGWMPWTRAIGLLAKAGNFEKAVRGNKITANFIASSMAGGTAFSPNHQNIGNDLQHMDNHLAGAVSEFLATNPNDPEALNRLRNAVQEGGLSLIGDKLILPAARMLGRSIGQYMSPMHEKLIATLDLERHRNANKIKAYYGILGRGKKSLEVDKEGGFKASDSPHTHEQLLRDKKLSLNIPKGKTAIDVIKEMDKSGALDEKFRSVSSLEEKSILAQNIAEDLHKQAQKGLGTVEVGAVKWDKTPAGGFKTTVGKNSWRVSPNRDGKTFSLFKNNKKIGDHASVKAGKSEMAKLAKIKPTKTIPRVTLQQIQKDSLRLFEEVGLDAEMIRNLPPDMGWNPTQIYSFGRLVKSTHDEMFEAIKKHSYAAENDVMYKQLEANALRTMANHADSIAYLKNSLSTAGRSLQVAKQVKKQLINKTINADMLNSPELAQVIRTGKIGGHDVSRMSQMILQAYEQNGVRMGANSLITGIAENEGGLWNQFIEGWINQGLLSNPATHALNTATGLANVAGHITSQITAATLSKITFRQDPVLFREAFGSMYGLLMGLNRSFRLAFRASLTNEQVITKGTKIENYGFKHLAAEHMGKGINGADGTALGLGFDFMGGLNRLPGRFLLMEDEFVKSISYEMNLHSKAWKYAWGAKGKGNKDWYTSRKIYKDIIDNPKLFEDQMGGFHEQGQELANLMTFQQEVPALVNRLSGTMQDNPWMKLFVPFMKVLTNIPRYVIRHSPAGFIKNDNFKKGGATQMLEIGRMAYGTMLMLYGGHLYNSGNMTGTGQRQYHQRRNPQDLGTMQEVSLKIKPFNAKSTDKYWVDISRFQPMSSLLNMGADIAALQNVYPNDPEMWTEAAWKGLTSLQKNLISGTWGPNLHKLLGVMADPSSEPKDWDRATKSIVGTLQPAFVRAYEKHKHPDQPEMKTYHATGGNIEEATPSDWSAFRQKLLAVSPSHSDLVKSRRNVISDKVQHAATGNTGLPEILNNPMVSFLTFRKANDNQTLAHLFGGSSDATKEGYGRDLELPISPPSDKLDVGRGRNTIQLSDEEYDYYTEQIGTIKDMYEQTLQQAWERMYKTDWYKRLPAKMDGSNNDKTEVMMGIYNQFKKRARQMTIDKYGLINRGQTTHQKYGMDVLHKDQGYREQFRQ